MAQKVKVKFTLKIPEVVLAGLLLISGITLAFSSGRFIVDINKVGFAVSTKIQFPGLTGIKFSIRKEKITLLANNNEISIQAVIKENFNCIDEGDFIVSGKLLLELIKKISSKDIDFMSFDEKTVKIYASKNEYKLSLIDLESFIEVSFAIPDLKISLEVLHLKQLIRKTSFAISQSDARPVYNGISFSTKGTKLVVQASDGYRVSINGLRSGVEYPPLKIIIPGKSFEVLNKIMSDSDGNVDIYCTSTYVIFSFSNILFRSRLIDGVFPELERLIPKQYISRIQFNKEELIETVERLSIFADSDASNVIKFSLINNGTVEFVTTDNSLGAAKEEIKPISIENDGNYSASVQTKYLLEALRAFDDEIIALNYTGETRPFSITSEKEPDLIQIILTIGL